MSIDTSGKRLRGDQPNLVGPGTCLRSKALANGSREAPGEAFT